MKNPARELRLPEALAGVDGRGRPSVWIVGAGGTGSMFAEAFASMQTTLMRLGHCGFDVTLFDPDTVSASNVGRQRFTSTDVGGSKSILLTTRINAFFGLNWCARPNAYVPATNLQGPSLLVTCTDRALLRAAIGRKPPHGSTIWLDSGNGQNSGQCVIGHLGYVPHGALRIPNIADLHPELAKMRKEDAEAPSCSTEEAVRRQAFPINRAIATAAIDLLWSLFRHGRIDYHGIEVELNPMRMRPLMIDPQAWEMLYGFKSR